ncbi:MAG: hypothetical protein ACLUHE_07805 [Christensenellales bacterium]
MPKAQIAAEVFDFLCRSILRMIAAAGEQTGARQALLAGGVASSTPLRGQRCWNARKRCTALGCKLSRFARPELFRRQRGGRRAAGRGSLSGGAPSARMIWTMREEGIPEFR